MVPATQLLSGRPAGGSCEALSNSAGPASGVLRGCETPGVAEETAYGIEISPTIGCRGAGGGGGADADDFPLVMFRNWLFCHGCWRAQDETEKAVWCCSRDKRLVRQRWQIIVSEGYRRAAKTDESLAGSNYHSTQWAMLS